jgi:hypothetical protein
MLPNQLRSTGNKSSVSTTIAAVTASKDPPDDGVLPPVPIFAKQNWGPYNVSDD